MTVPVLVMAPEGLITRVDPYSAELGSSTTGRFGTRNRALPGSSREQDTASDLRKIDDDRRSIGIPAIPLTFVG